MCSSVRLSVLATLLTIVHCFAPPESASFNQIKITEAAFKACIDDSDCSSQGSGYACFQYICYPWEDDSAVPEKDRKSTCKSNEQCGDDLKCFRHHDRRNIHKGLCMEEMVDCSENGESDCKHGEGSTHVLSMIVILSFLFIRYYRPTKYHFFTQALLCCSTELCLLFILFFFWNFCSFYQKQKMFTLI